MLPRAIGTLRIDTVDVAKPRGAPILCLHGLFAGSWFLRRPNPSDPAILTIILSSMGVGLALITSWLGGELVDRYGVGVAEGAHLDAPGSLSGRPASEDRVTY